MRMRSLFAVAAAGLLGCRGMEPARVATVYFSLDAPFCGMALPVEFYVDSLLVGSDTFRIHLPPDHTTSSAFSTAPGTHRLGARASIGVGYYVWPDTIVSLGAGLTFTRSLPFYCS
jgi:hypothetical protein